MPRIRFTVDPKLPRDLKHLGYRAGTEVEVTADQADRWLRRGVADVIADKPAKRPGKATNAPAATELLGIAGAPPTVLIRGTETPFADVVASAFKRSDLASVEAWNALTEADRERKLVDEVEALTKAAAAA